MDGPTSVNYGWSYFHMDSPTDKNPADSGLLPSIWMVLRINHLDLSLMVLRINPADCGLRTLDLSLALRTPDPGPFFGTTVQRILTKNIARSKDLWPGPDDYPPRCGAKNIARPLGLYQA